MNRPLISATKAEFMLKRSQAISRMRFKRKPPAYQQRGSAKSQLKVRLIQKVEQGDSRDIMAGLIPVRIGKEVGLLTVPDGIA